MEAVIRSIYNSRGSVAPTLQLASLARTVVGSAHIFDRDIQSVKHEIALARDMASA